MSGRLRLDARADGVVLRVRAAPGARRDAIVGVLGEALKVAVAAPPEKGKANERILALLAEELDLSPRCFRLESGATSRDKRVLVMGVPAADLRARIEACLSA